MNLRLEARGLEARGSRARRLETLACRRVSSVFTSICEGTKLPCRSSSFLNLGYFEIT